MDDTHSGKRPFVFSYLLAQRQESFGPVWSFPRANYVKPFPMISLGDFDDTFVFRYWFQRPLWIRFRIPYLFSERFTYSSLLRSVFFVLWLSGTLYSFLSFNAPITHSYILSLLHHSPDDLSSTPVYSVLGSFPKKIGLPNLPVFLPRH